MSWLKIDTGLRTHEKIWFLADELDVDVPTALGHMICLWSWGLEKNADQQGFINKNPKVIARASQYEGNANKYFKALVKCKLLDVFDTEMGSQVRIHNWESYGGAYLKRLEYDRIYKAKNRQAKLVNDCNHQWADVIKNEDGSAKKVCPCGFEWKV
tara:strand:+ start:852 stop:1319 length:468 start_codon:yes stop_codon:yes gene_type:complete